MAFALWSSPFTPARVAGEACLLAEPYVGHTGVHWLQSQPENGGRITVMRLVTGRAPTPLIPAPYSVRSRVNEYGGGAYAVAAGAVWFINDEDQALCRVEDGRLERVFAQTGLALGDLEWDRSRRRIVAISEVQPGGRQRIVAIKADGTLRTLIEGTDFYAAPRVSPDGTRLTWLEWSEADMPWDATRLMQGRVAASGAVVDMRQVAGGGGESLCQPEWSPDGALHVASDHANGFWNLCRVTDDGLTPVRRTSAECARPAFVFAQRLYAFTPEGGVLLAEAADGLWHCLEGALDGKRMRRRLPGLTEVAAVAAGAAGAALVAGGAAEPLGIYVRWRGSRRFHRVATSLGLEFDPGYVSQPEPITFASGDANAHALYFPPAHPTRSTPGLPPLRLRCHGGPTSLASSAMDPKTLYWTSRGFAVAELNYRGSSGYGRAYREALYGEWGVADVADACAAARRLAADLRCDPQRMIVAGSSAGGFTALHALRGASPFACGAVSYGVADLTGLAETSLRFEAHYGEKLVGPWPAARAAYKARSPLHCAYEIDRPTLFFQGADDPVVPRSQSEQMARALATRGVPVAYEVFPGERHGFRQPATIARTLAAELAFHAHVLKLFSPEPLSGIRWFRSLR